MPKKLVYGVGINDADYIVQVKVTVSAKGEKVRQKRVWTCPFYVKWTNMLVRCYSDKYQQKYPTYVGCIVCEDWLVFSNFKHWMVKQDYVGNQLDKDILFKDNKIYSPETCTFISSALNTFLTDRISKRGNHPLGVSLKGAGKYQAQCNNGRGGNIYLGIYYTPEEAHEAWRAYKHSLAVELAKQQTDPRVAEALVVRYAKEET